MRLFIFSILVCLLFGCTKVTFIEGLLPVSKTIELNQSIQLTNSQNNRFTLNLEGSDYPIDISCNRFKTTYEDPYYGAFSGDSILLLSIGSQIPIQISSGTVKKYEYDETIDTSTQTSNYNIPLILAIKNPPYNNDYISKSQIGTNHLNFGLNQDGYIAFKTTVNAIPIFGWAHIYINNFYITLEKYGYRTIEPGRAGQ